ncbi:hypothetical protein Sulku_1868 [Sulfuricurvum kujiense DSM 16994]|uniref:Uncharacterized protein n=1 Tax=Sulfuricurvum kujiense (strain ATCC BAA-921 / DSM 16994 / JCM 11577 / YK-1) TaxID=709032 RepID=E4U1Q5_SULKY|nr:hypothetical protein [Sulfuricurvum kujiense]ADR34528.1 hypothetical protein Sulku_1868 [Sulfuricurvum kujiense DSM 16994]
MEKYVLVKDKNAFQVKESKRTGHYVIKDKDITISILKEILIEDKLRSFWDILPSMTDTEIQLNWIKKEYIHDREFVNKYYPEFLI